ncbi:hypothetical protein C8J57DRAFT_1188728 [Mycena rebaudengoi]|nr:hypothetical protein C8J57DRAFT_1188728 [Mycena rebaudengoi]
MSNQFAGEQLLELLLQLKKTTPAAARQILNERPPIAYALITLMVSMNAINFDVFQKTLSDFGAANAQPAPAPAPPVVAPAIPPHIQPSSQPHSRTSTPPTYPSQPQNYGYPHAQPQYTQGYGRAPPPPHGYNNSGYGAPPPRPAPVFPDALASIPEEQKQMIMGVLAMTPEQINMLPPADRANILQLRATLGVPPP